MPRQMLIAAAAVAFCVAPAPAQETVMRDCQQQLSELAEEYDDLLGGTEAMVPPALLDLRSAAMRLVAQKRQGACDEVIEAMKVALESYREAGPELAARGIERLRPAPTRDELEGRVVPFGEAGLDSSLLQKAEVFNYNNQKLGEAEGLLLAGGQPTHLVIKHGGFWKVGGESVAVPVDLVRWDPEWQAFFIPIAEEELDRAPAYGAEGQEWNRETNDEFFASMAD